jgi:hypothetical protein
VSRLLLLVAASGGKARELGTPSRPSVSWRNARLDALRREFAGTLDRSWAFWRAHDNLVATTGLLTRAEQAMNGRALIPRRLPPTSPSGRNPTATANSMSRTRPPP